MAVKGLTKVGIPLQCFKVFEGKRNSIFEHEVHRINNSIRAVTKELREEALGIKMAIKEEQSRLNAEADPERRKEIIELIADLKSCLKNVSFRISEAVGNITYSWQMSEFIPDTPCPRRKCGCLRKESAPVKKPIVIPLEEKKL